MPIHAQQYPEGPSYPIRAISDGTFNYIRNLQPEKLYILKWIMGQTNSERYWPSWLFQSTNNEQIDFLVNRYMHRPAEELYNSVTDPGNMHNLSADEKFAATKQRLSTALDSWLKDQKDPGIILDTWEYQKAANQGKHKN